MQMKPVMVPEIAEFQKVSEVTVYRLIERCLISAYKAGDRGQLWIKDDEQYIESQGIQVGNQSHPSPVVVETYG